LEKVIFMADEIKKKWKDLGKDTNIIILKVKDKAYGVGIKYKDEKMITWAAKQFCKADLEEGAKLTLGKLITNSKFLNFDAQLKVYTEQGSGSSSGSSGSGSTKFDELGEKIDKLIEVIENLSELLALNAGMPKDGDKDDWGGDNKSTESKKKKAEDSEDEDDGADWDKKDEKKEKPAAGKSAW
jgi:hypothetical protein